MELTYEIMEGAINRKNVMELTYEIMKGAVNS